MKKLLLLLTCISAIQVYGQFPVINNKRIDTIYVNSLSDVGVYKEGVVYQENLPAPTALIDSIQTDKIINLYWTDNSSDEDGFIVFRSADAITYTAIDSVAANVTTYSNTGLTANTAYYYKVCAYKAASNSGYSNIRGDITYHKEIGRYISGLVTPLSYAQRARLNRYVDRITVGYGIDSLAQISDIRYILAGETQESSLRNLVKRSFDLTLSATPPTFTAFEGLTGNNTDANAETGYNPSTEATVYTLNDASLSIYSRTTNVNGKTLIGAYEAGKRIEISPEYSAGVSYWAVNDNSTTYAVTSLDSKGFFSASRTASNAAKLYQNGNLVSSVTTASSAIPNVDIQLLKRGGLSGWSNRQISYAEIGKSRTPTQVGVDAGDIEEYMDDLGKGVIAGGDNLVYREGDAIWIASKYNSQKDLIIRFGRTTLNRLIRPVDAYLNNNASPFISTDVETIGTKVGGSDDDISPLRRENMGWLSGNHGLDEDTIPYFELTSNYTIGQTTMALASAEWFPNEYGVGRHSTLGWFTYTGKSGNNLTGVSCPVNINAGDSVFYYANTAYTTEFEYSLDGDTILSNTIYYGDSLYVTTRTTVFDMSTYNVTTGLADTLYYEDVDFVVKKGTITVDANIIPTKTFNAVSYYGLTAAANSFHDTTYFASTNPDNVYALPGDNTSGAFDVYPCYRNVLSNAEKTINYSLYVKNVGLSVNRALNPGADMWIRYTGKSYNVFVGNTTKAFTIGNTYNWQGVYNWFDNQYLVSNTFFYAYPVYMDGGVYFFVDTDASGSDYVDISDFEYTNYQVIQNSGITFGSVVNKMIPVSSSGQGYAMIRLLP